MKKGSESAIKEWTSWTFLIQSLEIAFKTLYPSTPSKEKSFQNIYKKFTYELQRRCIILGIQEKTKELVDNLINYYFWD
jgi:hypothetical protein